MRIFLIVAALVLILISGYQIIRILGAYRQSEALYEDTILEYVTEDRAEPKESDDRTIADEPSKPEKKEPAEWASRISVDLEKLQAENKDIVGWLYFENEEISYPILYSGDNTKYLYTTYTMEDMVSGSIFMEGRNLPDFTDAHTIIYGHNMRNLSMFGRLNYYRGNPEYYKTHEYFQIITNEKYYRYRIFAYKDVSEYAPIYRMTFDSKEEFGAFIEEDIRKGSILDSELEVTKDDRIVTLSTCSGDGLRFTVSAVRVDEEDRA